MTPVKRLPERRPANAEASANDREIVLLQAIAVADRRAFDVLYRDYYPRLMDFLMRLLSQTATAEEVVNDTLYVVWDRADSFAGRSRVSTWIFGIAYKKALKRLEREGRYRSEPLSDHYQESHHSDSADDEVSALQLQETLDKALGKLSASHRSVVELTYQFGYSYNEIAEILGCPVNTVKTRMFHARARLRRILEAFAKRERLSR